MTHIPSANAFECLDCHVIGDRSESCACCGSQSIFNQSAVYDREAHQVRKEVAAVMGVYADVMRERVGA